MAKSWEPLPPLTMPVLMMTALAGDLLLRTSKLEPLAASPPLSTRVADFGRQVLVVLAPDDEEEELDAEAKTPPRS